MNIRDEIITGSFMIGHDGKKEPLDWKDYALKLEAFIEAKKEGVEPPPTEHLLSTEANRERLKESIREVENNEPGVQNNDEAVVASHTSSVGNSNEQKKLDAIERIIDSYDWENGDPGDIINRIQKQL